MSCTAPPRFMRPEVAIYSSLPDEDTWRQHLLAAQPFVAKGVFESPLDLAFVRDREPTDQVQVRNQVNGELGAVPLKELLKHLEHPSDIWYMSQQPVPESLQAQLPDPPPVRGARGVRPPNLWLGGRGASTDLHRDGKHNLIVQLDGTKDFVLFSPIDDPRVYAGSYPWPRASAYGDFARIGNTTRVELASYPNFRDASAVEVHLERGDVFFLPIYWWHQTVTHRPSLMLNYWWPAPLHAVLRGDIEEFFATPEDVLGMCLRGADLTPIDTDHALAQELLDRRFSLLAATMAQSVAEQLVRAIHRSEGKYLGMHHTSATAALFREGRIDKAAIDLLRACHVDAVDAGKRLGRPPPYPSYETATWLEALRAAHGQFGVAPLDGVCRDNTDWLDLPPLPT